MRLFGDTSQRGIPDWQDREWAAVSVLTVLGGVNNQSKSYFVICLNIGILPGQLSEFIATLEQYRGAGAGENTRTVLDECLA